MKQYTKLYIDGEWVDPIRSRSTFELVNPATEQAFASVALGDDQDVDRAVQAARRAFPAFSTTTRAERIAMLQRIAAVMQRREAELMLTASEEMGTPLSAVSHARAAVEQFKQCAAVLEDYGIRARAWHQRHPSGADRSLWPYFAVELAHPDHLHQVGLGDRRGLYGSGEAQVNTRP
ncbi:aldehyde dehydrogenase family protein [Cupriavidus basilensis]